MTAPGRNAVMMPTAHISKDGRTVFTGEGMIRLPRGFRAIEAEPVVEDDGEVSLSIQFVRYPLPARITDRLRRLIRRLARKEGKV